MKHINVQIKQTFREADYIANVTIGTAEKQQFQEFNQLPSWGRRIENIDKQQIPSIRIRTRKINNKNNVYHEIDKPVQGSYFRSSSREGIETAE